MTQPNPFSMANSLEHLVNPKIVTGATGYQVQVDIANVDTYYGRQLGGPTATRQFTQAFIQQIGTTGLPTTQAFINQLGTSGSSGSAFFNQIGTTGSSGSAFFNQIGNSTSRGDGYFNTIYWNAFSPALPSGGGSGTTFLSGPGISTSSGISGTTISSLIQGSTGISVNSPLAGQPYIIRSTVSVSGSTGISVSNLGNGNTFTVSSLIGVTGVSPITVTKTGNTFTVIYTGAAGPTAAPILGTPGQYSFFNANGVGLTSSSNLTTTNVVGPTGSVMIYSAQGPTYKDYLYTIDDGFPILVAPIVSSRNQNSSRIDIAPALGQNFIRSYGETGPALPLIITGASGTPNITNFNIPTGLVTINPTFNSQTPDYPRGVIIGSQGTLGATYGITGLTYNIYLFGGGGSGGVYSGGAGGFVGITGYAGTPGEILTFSLTGGTGGGGQGLFLTNTGGAINILAVAPGGGAGGSLSRGVAFGEIGGGTGQGFSASLIGGTGGFYEEDAIANPAYYKLTQPVATSGATFNNIPIIYGTTGTIASGTITFQDNTFNYNTITQIATFGASGATLTFNTSGMTFSNSFYGLTGVTFAQFSSPGITGIETNGIYAGLSGITGYLNGSSVFDSLFPSTLEIRNGLLGISGISFQSFSQSVGIDSSKSYFVPGGSTIAFSPGVVVGISGTQKTLTVSSTNGFTFSQSLGGTILPSVFLSGVSGPSGSIVQVGSEIALYYGMTGGQTFGGSKGGGGGYYGGGGGISGSTFQGGGGAGSAFLSGVVGITGAGSGTIPPLIKYNYNGSYGFGGSGTQGGSPYFVVEIQTPGTQPDILQVNGNEILNGSLTINQPDNAQYSWGALSFTHGNPSAVTTRYTFLKGSDTGGGGVDANALHLYRYGGTTYSFVNPAFAGSPILAIGEVSGTSPSVGRAGITGTAANYFEINGNTTITGNVNLVGGYYADSTQIYGNSGTAPSSLNINGNINATGVIRLATASVGTTGYGVVIGNGSSNNQTSNDLTVSGNINAAGATFTGQINGTTGVFSGSVTATDFTITSDKRLKENIQTVDSALDKIMKMRGVYFTRIGSERRNLGVIAQEVEEIIPEVVFTDESPEQMKSVAYGNIIGLLIEAVKELKEELDTLKDQNTM
jgi:hypothetical protein